MMKTFKEQLLQDQKVFFNVTEFAEVHHINDEEIPIIIDQSLLDERKIKKLEGTFVGEKLFLVESKYFDEMPTIDEQMIFDGESYFVISCNEEHGIYEIIISKNESY